MMPDTSSQKNQKSCLYWLQSFLSKRTHSELELITKLSNKGFDEDEIKEQIAFAKSKKWLEDPYDIAERVINKWNDKNKSYYWIENYLREKGLPDYDRDGILEVQKAENLLLKKFGNIDEENYNKAKQHLASKGFLIEDFEEAYENLNARNKV